MILQADASIVKQENEGKDQVFTHICDLSPTHFSRATPLLTSIHLSKCSRSGRSFKPLLFPLSVITDLDQLAHK
jgi:hypothetical protein